MPDAARRLLALASRAIPKCRPNPAVGAFLLSPTGELIGEGFTQPPGNAHAEVMAIRAAQAAGHSTEGAELFVSLEPCSHYGRTPPCVLAIEEAKIRKVHYGYLDPNPEVAGKGIEYLTKKGIETELIDDARFAEFYESYAYFVKHGQAFVDVKIAESADGFVAGPRGERLQISDEKTQKKLHLLRSECDAVLIGGGTLNNDDPSLTVRLVEHSSGRQPLRIVFNGLRRLNPDAKLFTDGFPTLVFSRSPQDLPSSVPVLQLFSANFAENWTAMLQRLKPLGLHHILVEAGPTLARNLLENNLQNRLRIWTSEKKLGEGLPWRPQSQ
jgi:diaminohydroxyphosphoribosylaminopyrimidine deaminase/5-amino-6-(5-phosphoribosylamino)uracil reductase